MKRKTAIITGGTRGIGRASVLKLLDDGWNVVAFSRSKKKREALIKALKHADKDRYLIIPGDVAREADCRRVMQRALKQFKTIDVLFNNAGFGYFADVEKADMKRVRDMFDTNVLGLMYMTRAVVPHMKRRKRGLILNMASIAGKEVYPNGEFYGATKFAVNGFVDGIRKELRPFKIKVATLSPGMIRTDFFDKREMQRRMKQWKGAVPPMMDVEDITRLVSLICNQSEVSDIRDILIMPHGYSH